MYRWKKCIKGDLPFCENIYPIQQQKVKELYDYLIQNDNVKKITLFGSSITPNCHIDSDVDLYIELEKNEKIIKDYFPFQYDIWTNFTVDERLKKEINVKGLVLYGE